MERLPYVTHVRQAYEHVGKNYDWYIHSRAQSPNFVAAVAWVLENSSHVPTYDPELLALEAEHYLVQVMKGEVKGNAHRIAVAKHFAPLPRKGQGTGKGGRQIFRADDDMGLTNLPSSFSVNGPSAEG